MRFLLKIAFWMGVVLVLLPSGTSKPVTGGPQIGSADAISAASAAVTDMRKFCERQPAACDVGSQSVTALGHRAQAGAKILYEFLSEQFGPNDQRAAGTTGSIPARGAAPSSQNTLIPADRAIEWLGPAPQREARANRAN